MTHPPYEPGSPEARAEVDRHRYEERIKLAQRHRQDAYEQEVAREADPFWQIADALQRLAAAHERIAAAARPSSASSGA